MTMAVVAAALMIPLFLVGVVKLLLDLYAEEPDLPESRHQERRRDSDQGSVTPLY